MKRQNIIKTLIGATCLSLAVATLSMTNVSTASAEATVSTNDLTVVGAGVRFDANATAENDDGTGLRFCLRASESYLEQADEVGLLLIPAKNLTGELTVATEGAVKNVKAYDNTDGDAWKDIASAEDWANVSTSVSYVENTQIAYSYVYNIPLDESETKVVARGYAKVDGSYVYTDEMTRSMRSVAISAYKAGDIEDDVRTAIEKYTDVGNVAYLGTSYLDYNLKDGANADFKLGYNPGYAEVSRSEATTPAGETVPALGLIATAGSYNWLTLNLRSPAIKDISNYKYMYVWVYTVSETNKTNYRMGFNNTSANTVSLAPNAWTQIVFENVDGTWKAPNGSDLFTSAWADTTATTMDHFQFCFYGMSDAERPNFKLTDMYVCNELPTLTLTTEGETMNSPITVSQTANFETAGVTFTTSVVYNGVKTKLDSASYTPTNVGEYTFIVEAEKNGKLVAVANKSVFVQDPAAALATNVGCWNTENWKDYATSINGDIQDNKNGAEFTVGTGAYASPMGGTSIGIRIVNPGAWTGGFWFKTKQPAVTDITSYKYVFVWIYTTSEGGLKLLFGESCRADVVEGQWTRLVFEKQSDGRFYLRGGSTTVDMFGSDRGATSCNESNIVGHGIRIHSLSGTVGNIGWTYFGGFYACNELPKIPAGMLDWGLEA